MKVWRRYFTPCKALNSGIGGNRAESVLLWAINLSVLSLLKNMVLLCEANIFTDFPTDIADCIVNSGSCLREISSNINVFICVLIPRDVGWSVNRVLIKNVNRILEYLCLKHDFSFIDQSNGWTLDKWHSRPFPVF